MEKVLEVKALNKSFGDTQVLHDINFDIYKNEIVGFIGHNGAGKSTVMKCIMSLIFPTEGEIVVNGYNIETDRMKALKCMAGVIEEPGLFRDLSGEDNIRLFAELRGVGEDRVKEVIEFTKLGKHLKRKAGDYSMGMKQRLALAIALLSKPKLLILDEPTNGLDPTSVIELRETLLNLVSEEDISILFSSHQLEEVDKLSDRLVCINKGKIVDVGVLSMDRKVYRLKSKNMDLLREHLKCNKYIYKDIDGDFVEIEIFEEAGLHRLLMELGDQNILVTDISLKELSLEERYREIYLD